MTNKITVSERAKKEILKLLKEEKRPNTAGFRFGIDAGGCSGFMYRCSIADKADKHDEVFEFQYDSETVKVFVDKKSLLFASGTHIDYKRALMGAGFQFSNPNSTASCGCGESFAV